MEYGPYGPPDFKLWQPIVIGRIESCEIANQFLSPPTHTFDSY